jgi:hypothetical protein
MPNVFDQFDPPQSGANVFDQFDSPGAQSAPSPIDSLLTTARQDAGAVGGVVSPMIDWLGQQVSQGFPSVRGFVADQVGNLMGPQAAPSAQTAADQTQTPKPIPDPGAGYAFGRAAVESFLGNMLGVPDLLLKLSTPVQTGMQIGQTMAQDGIGAGLASLGERQLPLPSGEQATAALDVLNQTLRGNLDPNLVQRYRESLQAGEAAKQAHPIASGAGGLLGDAATIFTGRLPITGAPEVAAALARPAQTIASKAGDVVDRLMKDALAAAQKPAAKPKSLMERLAALEERGPLQETPPGRATVATLTKPAATTSAARTEAAVTPSASPAPVQKVPLEPGLRRAVDRWTNSASAKTFARGAKKSLEAGIEGAVLSILDQGDPLDTAAFAAGGQAAGSLALALGTTKKGLAGLAASAAVTGYGLLMLKEVVPGGRDRILESLESGAEHVAFAGAMGLLAGMLGAGRIRGEFAKDFPRVADAITAFPRGAMISLWKEWAKAPPVTQKNIESTVSMLSADPEYFTADERAQLGRGLKSGSLAPVLERLSRRPSFRQKLDYISQ